MRLEHWFYTIPLRFRSVFRRCRMEQELEEELELHLLQEIEQGVAMGQTADEARYAALRAMEGIEQRKEECRDARRVHWLEDLLQDVCYAFRILSKADSLSSLRWCWPSESARTRPYSRLSMAFFFSLCRSASPVVYS